jgi:hypothetical protein
MDLFLDFCALSVPVKPELARFLKFLIGQQNRPEVVFGKTHEPLNCGKGSHCFAKTGGRVSHRAHRHHVKKQNCGIEPRFSRFFGYHHVFPD